MDKYVFLENVLAANKTKIVNKAAFLGIIIHYFLIKESFQVIKEQEVQNKNKFF